MMPRRGPTRSSYGVALLAFACGACSQSVSDVRPSPIPAGYLEALSQSGGAAGTTRRERERGEQVVDGLVAAVGDRTLTRSEVLRRLRVVDRRGSGSGDQLDAEIDAERIKWAEDQLIGIAARQAGLRAEARMVDRVLDDKLKELTKEASEKEGRPVSHDEWLASKKVTREEFRRQLEDETIAQLYVSKLLRGIGGPTRPEVDIDVTPAEVRRIFRDHPEAFDKPAAVRAAVFVFYVRGLADDEHTPAEWQELAERRAEQLAQLFREGHDPEFLARRYGLDQEKFGQFTVATTMQPIDQIVARFDEPRILPGLGEWLDRPDVGARQTFVVRKPEGPIVYGVLEHEPMSRRSFEDAYDGIVRSILQARGLAARARVVIRMLSAGSVVSPPELEDKVLDRAQAQLDEIASNEIMGKVRLQ